MGFTVEDVEAFYREMSGKCLVYHAPKSKISAVCWHSLSIPRAQRGRGGSLEGMSNEPQTGSQERVDPHSSATNSPASEPPTKAELEVCREV